ncbi:hypothetical protein ACWCQZ_45630, partial [Streptomyces sp. NPDC002285]
YQREHHLLARPDTTDQTADSGMKQREKTTSEGRDVKDEDVVRLSPLKDRHINFLGRYLFNIQDRETGQGLRPLRDPSASEDASDME